MLIVLRRISKRISKISKRAMGHLCSASQRVRFAEFAELTLFADTKPQSIAGFTLFS
jgi:hypothetical protein